MFFTPFVTPRFRFASFRHHVGQLKTGFRINGPVFLEPYTSCGVGHSPWSVSNTFMESVQDTPLCLGPKTYLKRSISCFPPEFDLLAGNTNRLLHHLLHRLLHLFSPTPAYQSPHESGGPKTHKAIQAHKKPPRCSLRTRYDGRRSRHRARSGQAHSAASCGSRAPMDSAPDGFPPASRPHGPSGEQGRPLCSRPPPCAQAPPHRGRAEASPSVAPARPPRRPPQLLRNSADKLPRVHKAAAIPGVRACGRRGSAARAWLLAEAGSRLFLSSRRFGAEIY